MKSVALVVGISLASILSANAASFSYSFWHYDQYAGSTPYYSHFQIGASTYWDTPPTVLGVNLNHGNPYVYTHLEGVDFQSIARSIGWHQYVFSFDNLTMAANIAMDGNTIFSGSYTEPPVCFRFVLHDHLGGPQETVIDDFQYRINGNLVYQQSFETGTLDSNWIISRQDVGTYVTSGDPTLPHSGTGSLALGSTNWNNNAVIVTFVPEPSSMGLIVFSTLGLLVKRKR